MLTVVSLCGLCKYSVSRPAGEAGPESLPGQSWVRESMLVLSSSVPNSTGFGKGFSFSWPWVFFI